MLYFCQKLKGVFNLVKIFKNGFDREEGFTLLELLATIVVLSLFGYVLIAIIGGIAQQTSDTAQNNR